MKKLRIPALVTAAALLGSALSGCATQPAASSTGTQSAASQAGEVASSAAEAPATIHYYFWYSQTQPDMQMVYDEINKYVKDTINVDVQMHGMTRDDYQQKIPTIMAAGGDWDICFTSGNLNQYLPNVAKNAFAPLNDLLDTNGKELKEFIPQSLWDAVSVNKQIYGVPMYKEIGHSIGLFIDQGIADECGIDVSTLKDFKTFNDALYTVKEKMPDVMPYALDNSSDMTWLPIETIANDWDLPAVLNIPWLDTYKSAGDDNGKKVFNPYEQPEFKNMVDTIHQWWNDGLVPKDPLGWKDKNDTEMKAGHVFAMNMWTAPNYDAVLSHDTGRTWTWLPVYDAIFAGSDAFGGLNAINANSKNKEAAMKFLNLLNTDIKLGDLMKHGIEGTHYVLNADGQADPSQIAGYDATAPVQPYNQSSAWQYFTIFNQHWDVSYPKDIANIYLAWNDSSKPSPNLGFTYDSANMTGQIAALQTTIGQYSDALMYGTADPSVQLPEFISKMKANGSDELIADVQAQLDAWRTANGK